MKSEVEAALVSHANEVGANNVRVERDETGAWNRFREIHSVQTRYNDKIEPLGYNP